MTIWMKLSVAAMLLVTGVTGAWAQTDMSCADLLKMNAQLDAKTKAMEDSDPSTADMNRKVNEYCAKNPKATASEAMEKAMQ